MVEICAKFFFSGPLCGDNFCIVNRLDLAKILCKIVTDNIDYCDLVCA